MYITKEELKELNETGKVVLYLSGIFKGTYLEFEVLI